MRARRMDGIVSIAERSASTSPLRSPAVTSARGRRSTTCVITPLPFAPIRRTTAPAFWRPRRRNHGVRGTWWRRWVRSFTRTRFTPGFVRRRRRRWVVPLLIPRKPFLLEAARSAPVAWRAIAGFRACGGGAPFLTPLELPFAMGRIAGRFCIAKRLTRIAMIPAGSPVTARRVCALRVRFALGGRLAASALRRVPQPPAREPLHLRVGMFAPDARERRQQLVPLRGAKRRR